MTGVISPLKDTPGRHCQHGVVTGYVGTWIAAAVAAAAAEFDIWRVHKHR